MYRFMKLCTYLERYVHAMYMYIDIHICTYMYMHFVLWMYQVHTCTWIYIFICAWYKHVHRYYYMYEHCTHTSVHVQNCTSFPIMITGIPDQPCDAGESLLRARAAPSELPPSWHQSFQLTDHPGMESSHLNPLASSADASLHKVCVYIYT